MMKKISFALKNTFLVRPSISQNSRYLNFLSQMLNLNRKIYRFKKNFDHGSKNWMSLFIKKSNADMLFINSRIIRFSNEPPQTLLILLTRLS